MLQRPLDVGVEALVKHDPSLDSIDSLCRKDFAMYGSYFGIEFGRPDPDTFEMRVDRCFFRDFFDRHGARPVTTVLCGWDANWMQALDPATSGLQSERPTEGVTVAGERIGGNVADSDSQVSAGVGRTLKWRGMWRVVLRRGVWVWSIQRGGRQCGTPSIM